MNIPIDFARRLQDEFNGRLRVRWSVARQEWHIEQRVGRAALPPFRISEIDDRLIRYRDGYAFVMAIRPGDRMPCPTCHLTVKVPVLKTGEAVCSHCQFKGRDGRYKAAYFPLNDILLEHLRKIDPERGGIERVTAEADQALVQRERSIERNTKNQIEAGIKEDIRRVLQIPQVGYTGKEFTG
jgi:hypothetical protein